MSSHVQNQTHEDNKLIGACEYWVDETAYPPYVLIVGNEDKQFKVYDPKENYEVAYSSPTYSDVVHWLHEDEYVRVSKAAQWDVAA